MACPDCFDEKCNCRCGESIFALGLFVFVAAGLFWLMGVPTGWNEWKVYHDLNFAFFYLSGILAVGGVLYAGCSRKTAAFSREPKVEEHAQVAEKSEPAPTPYVMLA